MRRNAIPCPKGQLSDFECSEHAPLSSTGNFGVRRDVPVAPLLAPEPKAGEKTFGRRGIACPPPKKLHFLHIYIYIYMVVGIEFKKEGFHKDS